MRVAAILIVALIALHSEAWATCSERTIAGVTVSICDHEVRVTAGGVSGTPEEVLCTPGRPFVLFGHDYDDVLTGTDGDDIFCGLGGDDKIYGSLGNDIIIGGDGDDLLVGGYGGDLLSGGRGNDKLSDASGEDVLSGDDGDDQLRGGRGGGTLYGGLGDDRITGGPDGDVIVGNEGNDVLRGAKGDDRLDGGEGVDRLSGQTGSDSCLNGEVVKSCERTSDVGQGIPDQQDIPPAPPGTIQFTGGPGLEGIAVEIVSSGGIAADEITVRPSRTFTFGLSAVAASPVYDISVPHPENVESATITLPYDPALLDGSSPDTLTLATYLESAQMWVPINGPATVDIATATVTASVPHLSMYAIVKGLDPDDTTFWTPGALARLFGSTPVRCVQPGTPGASIGVDVVFVVDSSGSMATNDPSAKRVDAAKAFLNTLHDDDRAAVVDFDDVARTLIGLTSVATPSGRSSIASALNLTGNASGGTNIGTGVDSATTILESNGGGGRLRIAILLTDGDSSYDPDITRRAASSGVAVYTVGLGSGSGSTLLAEIAAGTGGRFLHAPDAQALVALYQELAGDIIDDGTDTDGDSLTDCEERNGLLSPFILWIPSLGTQQPLPNNGVFSFTDPSDANTDGDGTPDGQEVLRVRFDDDPDVAHAFQVMVAAGRETYFRTITGRPDRFDTEFDGLPDPTYPQLFEACPSTSGPGPSPFAWDSDNDDISDGAECLNGTDPLRPDNSAYGIDGLPPFTLFAPERYQDEWSVHHPIVPAYYEEDDGHLRRLIVNDASPVFYDDDYNCSSNCDAITAWAQAKGDDNGFGVCLWGRGDCKDDADQIRDKIRGIVNQQAVFDDDGHLSKQYFGRRAAMICLARYDPSDCDLDSMVSTAGDVADDVDPDPDSNYRNLNIYTTVTFSETLGDRVGAIRPDVVTAIAAELAAHATLYRDRTRRDIEERQEAVARAIEACFQTRILEVAPFLGELHPCEAMPIFLPGELDAGGAARNDFEAIKQDVTKIVLQYAPAAEREAAIRDALVAAGKPSSEPRYWYNQYDECRKGSYDTKLYQCDEYPLFATTRSGPPTTSTSITGSRLEVVPAEENLAEGTAYRAFTNTCRVVRTEPRQPFIVVPLVGPLAGPTDFVCP